MKLKMIENDGWTPEMSRMEKFYMEQELDPDPDFRAVIKMLNDAGHVTTSSCQGHAPGTQYDYVDEWMEPYITFNQDEYYENEDGVTTPQKSLEDIAEILDKMGVLVGFSSGSRTLMDLSNDINWAEVRRVLSRFLNTGE